MFLIYWLKQYSIMVVIVVVLKGERICVEYVCTRTCVLVEFPFKKLISKRRMMAGMWRA
jgi:hypothetical protein